VNRPEPSAHQVVAAERTVVQYFRHEAFAGAERIPRQGHSGEPQGIRGVPFTTVQVKHPDDPLQPWITSLLRRRDATGDPFCLLVVQSEGKEPEFWDAYLPPMWELECANEPCPEQEAWTWTRMDLRLAVAHLSSAIRIWGWAKMYALEAEKTPTVSGIQAWISAARLQRSR
jgi:hypothetical protein